MTKTSAETLAWISKHRAHTFALLFLLMVLPVLMIAWTLRKQAPWPLSGSLMILGVAYCALALALLAFLAWLYAQMEMAGRFMQLSTDLFCIAGFDGHFKYLNSSWRHLLGFANAELMSRPYLEFVHPEDRMAAMAEAQRLQERETTLIFDNRYVCANGSYKWLVWSAVSVPDKELVYAVGRDVTEIKETARVLEQNNLELGEYLGLVAPAAASGEGRAEMNRDLHAHLDAITSLAGLLISDVGGKLNPKQKSMIGEVKNRADRLAGILRDRMESTRKEPLLRRPPEEIAITEMAMGEPGRNPPENPPTLPDPVVLLVDDDVSGLRLLNAMMRRAGYQTRLASNGKAALSVLSVVAIDAIVADLVMPEMDGFELIQAIRESARLRHVPIFVLTSRHLSRDEVKLLARQTEGLFQKGRFWGPDLVASVEEVIRRNRASGVGESA